MVSVNTALSVAINAELDRQRNKIADQYAVRAVEEIKKYNKERTALYDQFKRYESEARFISEAEKQTYADNLHRLHVEHQETLAKMKRAYYTELCYRGLAIPDMKV